MGPHPEVPDALRRLRERYELAIFTNSDEDLIVHNVARLGVPIDYVITAERAQAYKPSHQLFEYAYRTMGVTKEETVHVAMGMFLDMKACHELGVRGIWVNRPKAAARALTTAAKETIRAFVATTDPDAAELLADYVVTVMTGLSAMAREGHGLERLLSTASLAAMPFEHALHV